MTRQQPTLPRYKIMPWISKRSELIYGNAPKQPNIVSSRRARIQSNRRGMLDRQTSFTIATRPPMHRRFVHLYHSPGSIRLQSRIERQQSWKPPAVNYGEPPGRPLGHRVEPLSHRAREPPAPTLPAASKPYGGDRTLGSPRLP